MPIIVLSKEVASKIAAGEVVERPVSVVKELVENSIDAGATDIHIRIEQVGKKMIEIIDNGSGIESDSAHIAIQRYATSKITTAEDLERVKTLGFRGEALASIAAVSRMTIESREKAEETGFHFHLEGGEAKSKNEIGKSIGTLIRVEDLFFNVPARLKFLKKDITENRLITMLITRYALFYVGIRFSLFINGKKMLNTNGNNDRREVLSQIYDLETAKSLHEVNHEDDYLRIEGFTSPLGLTRSSRKEIFFFINGRLVSDSTITSAITQGYQGLLMVGRSPITNLFISIPPEEIDVNVHPTKSEIRLRDSKRVFSAVQRTIRKTISAFAPYPTIPLSVWGTVERSTIDQKGSLGLFNQTGSSQNGLSPGQNTQGNDLSPSETNTIPLLRPIGQLGLTYIAAEGPDGLYLIDQHAAHERILFEKLISISDKNRPSQMLIEPAVIDVHAFQIDQIESQLEILTELGFQIEKFGPSSYKITALPQIISKLNPYQAFLSLIEEDEESSKNLMESEKKEKIITRICKRLAIKAGQVMNPQEQSQLIRDLENCSNPRTCPHGRPTMIHLSVDLLERQFGRKGSV